MSGSHMGRAFTGHTVEDTCPCPKVVSGLVDFDTVNQACPQHSFHAAKTMRQGHLGRDCPDLSPEDWAAAQLEDLDTVIAYMEGTAEDSWNLNTVRSRDGAKNCFFGHLFSMSPDEARANALWGLFENAYASTYVVYPVNDGTNPRYQQATPKHRILAYLRALQTGDEMTTDQSMEADYQRYLAGLDTDAAVGAPGA